MSKNQILNTSIRSTPPQSQPRDFTKSLIITKELDIAKTDGGPVWITKLEDLKTFNATVPETLSKAVASYLAGKPYAGGIYVYGKAEATYTALLETVASKAQKEFYSILVYDAETKAHYEEINEFLAAAANNARYVSFVSHIAGHTAAQAKEMNTIVSERICYFVEDVLNTASQFGVGQLLADRTAFFNKMTPSFGSVAMPTIKPLKWPETDISDAIGTFVDEATGINCFLPVERVVTALHGKTLGGQYWIDNVILEDMIDEAVLFAGTNFIRNQITLNGALINDPSGKESFLMAIDTALQPFVDNRMIYGKGESYTNEETGRIEPAYVSDIKIVNNRVAEVSVFCVVKGKIQGAEVGIKITHQLGN